MSLIFVSLFGTTFIQSLGARTILHAFPMFFTSLTYFYFDLLIRPLAIPMFLAAILAGFTGSKLALKIGNRSLKIIFSLVVVGLAIWLLLK